MLCAVKSHCISNYAGSRFLKQHKINSQILLRLVACLTSYNIPCALGVFGWILRALTHLTFMSSAEGSLSSGKFSVRVFFRRIMKDATAFSSSASFIDRCASVKKVSLNIPRTAHIRRHEDVAFPLCRVWFINYWQMRDNAYFIPRRWFTH